MSYQAAMKEFAPQAEIIKLRAALVRVIQATGGSATAEASTDFLCIAPDEVAAEIRKASERYPDVRVVVELLTKDLDELRTAVRWLFDQGIIGMGNVTAYGKEAESETPKHIRAALAAAIEGPK